MTNMGNPLRNAGNIAFSKNLAEFFRFRRQQAAQQAQPSYGGLGAWPLKTARAKHRTGTPAHVKAWREQADALLVERAREYGVQEVPRVRLAFASGRWSWARRLIVAETARRAQIAAGKVPF